MTLSLLCCALPIALLATCAHAQTKSAPLADLSSANSTPSTYKTFYLSNLAQPHDANDIVTDLRNMLPQAKLYYVQSQSALSIRGSEEDLALAQKILADVDRTRKVYRLTYTITDIENGQPAGKQHVTLVVASGGNTDVKQGSKVPMLIGASGDNPPLEHSNVQYMDVGLEIEASLNESGNGVRSKIAQSRVAEERSGIGAQDPIFRQTTLDTTAILTPGKPLILGSLDIPGTTRRQQVEVVSEPLP